MKTYTICKIKNCIRESRGHGFCKNHLYRFKKYGNPLAGRKRFCFPFKKCLINTCNRESASKIGYCKKHYARFKKYDNPLITKLNYETNRSLHNGFPMIKISKGKWIKESRYLMQKYLKRKLKSWEIVHHKDGNPLNNLIKNFVITRRSKHCKTHQPHKFHKNLLSNNNKT